MSLMDYEGIFRNENALNYEFIPREIFYRDSEKEEIASVFKQLLDGRDGRNILIYGPPGVGKTLLVKHLLRELEENKKEKDINLLYVNCWKYNSSYKVIVEMCKEMGYGLTANKNTNELMDKLALLLNKAPSIIVLDEVDKLDDNDILYFLSEDIYKKSIVMITNYREWYASIEERLRSRLLPREIEFKPYNKDAIRSLLLQRIEYAFKPNVWEENALNYVIEETYKRGDFRIGLFLLKDAGIRAEEKFSEKIVEEYVLKAIESLPSFTPKEKKELDETDKTILKIINDNPGKRIGYLYNLYCDKYGIISYKTFQRRINRLDKNGFISTRKVHKGGSSTIIDKKIKDYE